MKFTILLLIFCCFFSFSVFAQATNYSVKGEIIDTAAKVKLENSSVIILNAKELHTTGHLRAHLPMVPSPSITLSKGKIYFIDHLPRLCGLCGTIQP